MDSKSAFVGYPPGRISLRPHPRTAFPRSSRSSLLLSVVGRDTPKDTPALWPPMRLSVDSLAG